ncbi:alpha-L-fucosidase [Cohnella sp. GCM10020058]|uniref:alpha-L-fucosidase n=1 Tax=Cohnella sp. GCM10020058 TaxID=3317330 RepID=UPI00364543FB
MSGPTREQRLAAWFDHARIGLFLHWGMLTGEHEADPFGPHVRYPYETPEAFETAAAAAGWSAGRWVDTAKRLRAKYITIATYHCELGYLKVWPSGVPGSPCTRRDFLGELIEAADAAGIRVIVYINRSAKNAVHGGITWLDKEAYQAYKNDADVDIATDKGFLAYSLDVIYELIDTYPKLAGFWFDGYHDKAEAQPVFAGIHARAPGIVTINNDFSHGPVADEDVMSLEEFGKVCEPDYDYASGAWVGPGQKEYAFRIKLNWFYVGRGQPDWAEIWPTDEELPANAYYVKQLVSVIGASWNANLGYGPLIGGDFPAPLEDFTAHLERFMSWAEEAIYGTVGGGYGQGGWPPGAWNDGAYGATTLTPDGRTHYVHVLTPPVGNTLRLPDAGYDVLEATDLKTGRTLVFSQDARQLSIEVPSWMAVSTEGDLVIKLKTAPGVRLIQGDKFMVAESGIGAEQRSGAERSEPDSRGTTQSEAIQNEAAQAQAPWPRSVTLRLDDDCEIAAIRVLQAEMGAVTTGGYAAPVSERLKDYAVHLSRDGENWSDPVAQGTLRNRRGAQIVDFPPQTAAYVRLTVYGNYAGTGTFGIQSVDLVTPFSEAAGVEGGIHNG